MTSLAAAVASLAGSVERATVGSSALARDVAKLAASITLHGLSLAITSKVVGTTALVAGSRTRATKETTTEATTRTRSTATKTSSSTGSRASAGKVAGHATGVAAAVSTTVQTKGRAVSLHMSEALAVVTLFGLGGARKRAVVRLMTRLLAVVAQTLRGRADLCVVANIAALVAGTTGKRRHVEFCVGRADDARGCLRLLLLLLLLHFFFSSNSQRKGCTVRQDTSNATAS